MEFTIGKVVTLEEEIDFIEKLVDEDKVYRMVNVATEKIGPGLGKIHVMTLGTPLKEVRAILKVALSSITDMIGKE